MNKMNGIMKEENQKYLPKILLALMSWLYRNGKLYEKKQTEKCWKGWISLPKKRKITDTTSATKKDLQ